MSGFRAFVGKEIREIRRTWRIWVLPGMLLFFAISSPIIALLTPALVSSIAGSQPGLVIQIPPPTATDAYGQFLKNLSQLVLVAVVLTTAGSVSGERTAGTAVLTLTKPVSRRAFVLAKFVSQALVLVVFTVLSTAACAAVTAMLFPAAAPLPLVLGASLWLVYALLLVAVTLLLSAAFESRGAAAGLGLAFYVLTLILASWPPLAEHSFVGLIGRASGALAGGMDLPFWPLASAAAGTALAAAGAAWVFERKEL